MHKILVVNDVVFIVFGPVLKDGLSQLRLHDINDEKKVKIVGKVEYWLTEYVRAKKKSSVYTAI